MQSTDRRTIAQGTAIFIAMLGLSLGCNGGSTSPDGSNAVVQAAASVAQVAAAVTGQQSPLADEAKAGKNLGFDTHTFPGEKTMRAWKNAAGAPYSWVGYYLPSPCHKDASWTGKRQELTEMGWGIAVVYVGQQTWGKTPSAPLSPAKIAQLVKSGATCNAALMSSDRGAVDGTDAIAVAEREGFAPQSIIFLDIERMEKMPEAMRLYYRAWARALLRDGRYRPGVYVHAHNAQDVFDDIKAEFAAANVNEVPRMWIASGRGFEEGKAPQDVGFAFAGVWQGMIDVAKAVADIRLPVDVNVSTWKSPSEPASAATQ